MMRRAGLLFAVAILAGCTQTQDHAGEPLPNVAPEFASLVTNRAAIVAGNGSFGAYVDLETDVAVEFSASASDSQWVLLGPLQEPRECTEYPVGLAIPYVPTKVPAGEYLLLADTAFDTEVGFGSYGDPEAPFSGINGTHWAGTISSLPIAMDFSPTSGSYSGSVDVETKESAVIVVAVGTFARVTSPSDKAIASIGTCVNSVLTFGAGIQDYPVWAAAAAFVNPAATSVQVTFEGNLSLDPPRAYAFVIESWELSALLART